MFEVWSRLVNLAHEYRARTNHEWGAAGRLLDTVIGLSVECSSTGRSVQCLLRETADGFRLLCVHCRNLRSVRAIRRDLLYLRRRQGGSAGSPTVVTSDVRERLQRFAHGKDRA